MWCSCAVVPTAGCPAVASVLTVQVLDFARQLRRDNVLFNDAFFLYQAYGSPSDPHRHAEIVFRDVDYQNL